MGWCCICSTPWLKKPHWQLHIFWVQDGKLWVQQERLNTKFSTKAEVVGVSDYLLYNISICLFMRAQGYDINQNILFQDNQSEIKMEKGRKNSCTGNSRHIDISDSFDKDRIESNKTKVAYCSTDHMLADFFTKYLQWALFKISWRDIGVKTHRYP